MLYYMLSTKRLVQQIPSLARENKLGVTDSHGTGREREAPVNHPELGHILEISSGDREGRRVFLGSDCGPYGP